MRPRWTIGTRRAAPDKIRQRAEAGSDLRCRCSQVYTGSAEAFKDGVADVKVDGRTTLENADGNESFFQVCDLMSKEAKEQTVEYARVHRR